MKEWKDLLLPEITVILKDRIIAKNIYKDKIYPSQPNIFTKCLKIVKFIQIKISETLSIPENLS